MHSPKELNLNSDSVKITWCTCELCSAVGPRFVTLVSTRHEYTVDLNTQCCNLKGEDELVTREDLRGAGRHHLRNQIPR